VKHIKLILLVASILALAGCGNDDYDGGESGGGDYETYWGVIETISAKGYNPEMTQKPEAPAPRGDQEECPGAIALILLVLYYSWDRLSINQPLPLTPFLSKPVPKGHHYGCQIPHFSIVDIN